MADASKTRARAIVMKREFRSHPGGITLRESHPGEEQEVVDVLQQVFENWPPARIPVAALDFLEWVAEDRGSTWGKVIVAEFESRVVGVSLRIWRPVKIRTELHSASLGLFTAVLPEFRRRGLSNALEDFMCADMDLDWGFTQVEAYLLQRERRSLPQIGNQLSVFLRVQNAGRVGVGGGIKRALVNRLGYGGIQFRGWLQRWRALAQTSSCDVRCVDAFDGRVAALWEQASQPFDFIALRSMEFLNWRHCDPRGGNFTVLVAEQNGELLGYIVLAVVGSRGHIADLLVLPGREDVTYSLLREAMECFGTAGTSAVECTMMLQHPYTSTLRRAGFVRMAARSTEMTRKFAVEAFDLDPAVLGFLNDEQAKIHIVLGDSDLI